MLTLKQYQQNALVALESYLRAVRKLGDANTAFYKFTLEEQGAGIPYRPLADMQEMPYVCLRMPTGAGKTFVACHAIPVAERHYLHHDHPLVLWLVPSNAIREQTLAALRDRGHPYRQALDESMSSVTVLDVAEALHVQRSTLDSSTTILVSTLQAFRVEDTDGRKVYEPNGSLMTHFDGYPGEALAGLETWDNGEVKPSLANVIALRKPLVIVDEAHNARTELSFTTLKRFGPSAIIELTATPDTEANPSNVLHYVSAAELNAEDMIKMPILLQSQSDWEALLGAAIERRGDLERQARVERANGGPYLRPIMLLQAEANRGKNSLTVDVVENSLIQNHNIPQDQIARATGTDRGLDGVDILSEDCPIRYVITVQALREGWDCPFAYVLCSVAEMRSSTAVEQMLGRIMRLPGAQRKAQADLNRAYAFARSASFAEAAKALIDGLVQNGFEPVDAKKLLRPVQPSQQDLGPLWSGLQGQSTSTEPVVPAERQPFSVPVLLYRQGDLLEELTTTHFMDRQWRLSVKDARLSEVEYTPSSTFVQQGEIILEDGDIKYHFLESVHQQMQLLSADAGWTEVELAHWLDRKIPHPDIAAEESGAFILAAIRYLIHERQLTLAQLVQDKYRLGASIEAKIDVYRSQARNESLQMMLLPESDITVSTEHCFTYDPVRYPYNTRYTGKYQFTKHLYPDVGNLKPDGEEFGCAQYIDTLPEVDVWVRNPERSPLAFSLPTTTDRFYPDFVCRLNDGRYLVVEYKGQVYMTNDDSQEKNAIGELWEKRSGGTCLYFMASNRQYDSIRNKIQSAD